MPPCSKDIYAHCSGIIANKLMAESDPFYCLSTAVAVILYSCTYACYFNSTYLYIIFCLCSVLFIFQILNICWNNLIH